jgi:coiled-coil domain-containing protein 12
MEDALARKERLKALRAAAQAAAADDTAAQEPHSTAEEEPEKPVLKFRNYAVQDTKRIDHERVAAAQPPKFQEPVVETKPEDLPQEVGSWITGEEREGDVRKPV